jgi:hypothetical protein
MSHHPDAPMPRPEDRTPRTARQDLYAVATANPFVARI